MRKKKQQSASLTSWLIGLVVLLSVGLCYHCGASNESKGQTAQQTVQTSEPTSQISTAIAPTEETTGSTPAVTGDESLLLQTLPNGLSSQVLKREGYVASYNAQTFLPNYVAWNLTADHLNGTAKRKGRKFVEDGDVKSPRVDDWDYYGSGYDRGHMCPAADNKWSETAMEQSFLFTNCCPQDGNLNRGDWNEIEELCRTWARCYGSIYIVSGPVLFKGTHRTIGKHKVVVPEAFFKVVLCLEGTPKGIGFVCKNSSGNRTPASYTNSIKEVERITGYTFFPSLDASVAEQVKAQNDLSAWGQ